MLWLLYDLANNPNVQEKVYEEVLSLIGPHGDLCTVAICNNHRTL